MMNDNKKVVAALNDLMFTVKIQDAAKRAGLQVSFVKSREQTLEQAKQHPAVIILDLNDAALDALELIGAIKAAEETRDIPVLGFVSHVQTDLRQAAQEKGCDIVLPRSAFSHNLPALLKGYAES
jgi:CheY-like chemotaxis protein